MVVDKGCESCRWQEHYYWEHMDVTKIRFFKPLTGDFAKGIVSVLAYAVSEKESGKLLQII
jgi:sulfur transfer protein SufE